MNKAELVELLAELPDFATVEVEGTELTQVEYLPEFNIILLT